MKLTNRLLRKLGFANMDYVLIGNNEERALPHWLDYYVKNENIIFHGIPEEVDIG